MVTYVEQETNPFFGLAALLIMVVFGFLSFLLLPLGYMLTLSAVHRCSRCLQRLGERQCIGMPDDLSQPVWHFRFGKCSIVTARVYAVVVAVLIAILSCYYVYLRPNFVLHEAPLSHHNLESEKINESWSDYLVDCGGEKIIENSVHTKILWNEKYENNIVQWSGYFAESRSRNNGVWFSDVELNVLVKMEPSESTIFADLVMTVPSELYRTEKAFFDTLKKGDGIKFVAVVQGLGSEFKMHHLKALEVTSTGNFKMLNDILVRDSALP